MCGSEELIHDARQVDLEEMIMTNETPMYIVPGRLTGEQETNMRSELLGSPILGPADMFARMVGIVGTPIQPCADVETVGWVNPIILVEILGGVLSEMALAGCETPVRTIPLVRRTDMEAQVARVAAEKDAEIARLSAVLLEIVRAEPSIYDGRYLREIARTALNEGSVVGEKA